MGDTARTQVLVVGGGPVGLTMALLLHRFGVDCLLVERSPTTTAHPKARGITQRSMEIFRRLGVEDAIRARGLPSDADSVVFCESLAEREIGRSEPERPDPTITPSWKSMVAQDVVEDELFQAASRGGHATVRFGVELLSFTQSAEGVRAEVRNVDSGERRTVAASYLVAADGSSSGIRQETGIGLVGPQALRRMASNYWRGDMSRFPAARTNFAFNILPADPAVPSSFILNTNGSDRWLSSFTVGRDRDERDRPWTDAELIGLIRRQVGDPEQDVELLGTAIWTMGTRIAETFRRGRVLLLGDAAHQLVPVGGFGLNTGLQGALNLAWKLAFVLKGYAADRLLETYEQEHRPLAQSNADWSYANGVRSVARERGLRSHDEDSVGFWLRQSQLNYQVTGRSLGFTYEEGALIPDGTRPDTFDTHRYTPNDRPGARFPHLWVDLSRRKSTLDWFDRNLALVAGPLGQDWLDAGAAVTKRLNIPITAHLLPSADRAAGIHMGLRGAVLVRPDGHVAWRVPYLPPDPAAELTGALAALLPKA